MQTFAKTEGIEIPGNRLRSQWARIFAYD